MIGALVLDLAPNYTSTMIDGLDETSSRIKSILDELEALSRKLYPGKRFLRLRLKKEEMSNAVGKYAM
jgi:hypothetical protein